jgi:hypothetical protein
VGSWYYFVFRLCSQVLNIFRLYLLMALCVFRLAKSEHFYGNLVTASLQELRAEYNLTVGYGLSSRPETWVRAVMR